MPESESRGADWTSGEIDLIVADYFEMLQLELGGHSYVKSHRNEALRSMIARTAPSIEFKHRNISAVLDEIGWPWIAGYWPARNFQKALVSGVERHLDREGEIVGLPRENEQPSFAEAPQLFTEQAPNLLTADELPDFVRSLVRKFDPAARDARNRALGKKGEELVFDHERRKLAAVGRSDLARRVKWTSEEIGDGAGFDIQSFDLNGKERLLEVKTTAGGARTPFFVTENERAVSEARSDNFRLIRLFDFARQPRAYELTPPLEKNVILDPALYRASFDA